MYDTMTRRMFATLGVAAVAGLGLVGCTTGTTSGSGSISGSAGSAAESEPSSVRSTAYGDVVGIVQDDIEVYYNVPYGKDPTGDLRWHAPEEPDAWDETLDCSANNKKALQMATVYAADGSSSAEQQGTTDCLNLDVYTTADADGLPVLVYIHGGNNQTGSSTEIPGNEVVKRDNAVYVSLDYRLGLLGFNCLPALLDDDTPSGNFALLDIAQGLRWVQENIENFGGDPSNVTVSGFSAGGRNVMAMLVSPTFDGLFSKAAVYSGGMTIANQDESAQWIAQTLAPLAVEDGVADDEDAAASWLLEDSDEVRDYLFGLEAERLTELMSDAGIRMSAFPHLYGDDVVLPSTGFTDATYCNDVPILMLTGTDEFSLFCMGDPVYEELGDEADAAQAFALRHGSDLYRIFNTQTSAATMDDGSYQSDVFIAQVNYGGEDSENQIETFGSFHGVFAPMFGSHNYDSFYDFTEDGYQAMTDSFHAYLSAFLQDGDPAGDGDATWQPWTADDPQTMVFDAADGEALVEMRDVFTTPADVIAETEADDSISDEAKTRVMTEVMNGRWFSTLLDETTGTPQAVHLL